MPNLLGGRLSCFDFLQICFYIFRHVKEDEEENVELDDIVYDIEDSDDQYIDETDSEECGSGLIQKATADDGSILFLVFLQPLLDLAKNKSCRYLWNGVLFQRFGHKVVGSVIYIIWVRLLISITPNLPSLNCNMNIMPKSLVSTSPYQRRLTGIAELM